VCAAGAVAAAARWLRTRVRVGAAALVVKRRELALQLVLLQFHAILKLKPALEIVEPRWGRDVKQFLFNRAGLRSIEREAMSFLFF
jgi:hypothetical protein